MRSGVWSGAVTQKEGSICHGQEWWDRDHKPYKEKKNLSQVVILFSDKRNMKGKGGKAESHPLTIIPYWTSTEAGICIHSKFVNTSKLV